MRMYTRTYIDILNTHTYVRIQTDTKVYINSHTIYTCIHVRIDTWEHIQVIFIYIKIYRIKCAYAYM